MSACFEGDDRRTTCPTCERSIWLEDGCPTCDQSRLGGPSGRTRLTSRSPLSSGGASDDHFICGMHPAVAEHTLERCLNAFGGLAGLLVAIQAWEDEPNVA